MKLAAGNMKKNSKAYIPYILTGVMTVAMFYIVKSLSMNPGLEQMVGGDTLTYTMVQGSGVVGFFFSGKAAGETVLLFFVIFLLIFLNSVRQIQMSDPIDLLKAGNVGEKEPKTKFFTAAAGLGCLGTGYYIALTTENPIASLSMFFVAVMLVILGTYLLFTAGSIVLLKALRKNKKYYYRTKHFTSISGMIYRMKQNAVGLANICILSTAVLVMVSSTSSLMLGMEDVIRTRYPYDFVVYADGPQRSKAMKALMKSAGFRRKKT